MKLREIWVRVLLILVACVFFRPNFVVAEERGRVAVLPFRIHALKPLDHLERGLQKMLTVRVEKRGFDVVSPDMINKHPLAFLPQLEMRDIVKMGKDLGCDWIVIGSLTQIGERISLDLKMADVTGKKSPFFIFMVAQDIDALSETTERIAVSMDHHISGVAQVDSVRVMGNQRIEKAAILAVIGTKKGDSLEYKQIDKDLRDIYKMGFFEDVKTETEDGPRGKIVTFKVVEKPSIGKVRFEGNEKVDDDELREKLAIRLYSILDRKEIKQGINRLKEYYREKCYYNAEINERTEPLPNNQVLVEFVIKENEKVYVKKIQFEGNKHFDDGDLKDIMLTSEKDILFWFTDSGVLDKKKLEFDGHKITAFYHNHGFIKAKVGEPNITYEKDKGLTITIEVQEGEQYGVNTVSIEGDLIVPVDELMEKVRIGKEKVFNREVLRNDVLALKGIYNDEGYAYAEVRPLTKENDETRLVDVTYVISKEQKVRFERINISGNTTTRDKVIRRELKVIEGEYFSGKKLKKSSEKLERLGFFEDVEVQTKQGSREDLMILDVNVKEKPTGTFSFGAGYSSVDNVMGTVSVSENNLFGRGQRLSASVRIGGKSSQFDVTFTEPWILDKDFSGTVRTFKWEREYDDYTKDSLGGALTFGWPMEMIDEYTRAWSSYRYEDAEVSDISPYASQLLKDMEGRSKTSSFAVGLRRNSTDRPWNATRGSINEIMLEYAGGFLGGDNYFNKVWARSAWFFPFYWNTSFMAQGRWGYLKERSGGDLPTYEKWFLGGINTIRGFEYAAVSPYDPVTLDKVGGEKMMAYNLEYRFPLFKDLGITGVVFFDAGNV
ncbi:MAG: outer membrane protein assembly factor BamA, partial [Deltaproteobacteria bacterium]|nr:outer membrane protein assembly factor BamA [Deltaproteobacteria bacterium]